jgi:hypothetical protein
VIKHSPIIQSLQGRIEIKFHFLPNSLVSDTSSYRTLRIMSEAHSFAVSYSFDEKSYSSFLSPDMMVNSDFLMTMHEAISQNKKACLVPAFRMSYLDSCLNQISNISNLKSNNKFEGLQSSDLVKVALQSLHPETESFFFNKPTFLSYQSLSTPTAMLFNHKDNEQIVGFGMSWFLLMLNFTEAFKSNKKESLYSLKTHTIDAYFLNTFLFETSNSEIEFIRDSSKAFILSWDKSEAERNKLKTLELSVNIKLNIVYLGLLSGIYDEFKIKNLSQPWFWNPSNYPTDCNLENYSIPTEVKWFFSNYNTILGKINVLTYMIEYLKLTRSIKKATKNAKLDWNSGFSNTFLAELHSFISQFQQARKTSSSFPSFIKKTFRLSFYAFFRLFFLFIQFFRRIYRRINNFFRVSRKILRIFTLPKGALENPANQAWGRRVHGTLRLILNSRINFLFYKSTRIS